MDKVRETIKSKVLFVKLSGMGEFDGFEGNVYDEEIVFTLCDKIDTLTAQLKVAVEALESSKKAIKYFGHSEKCERQQSCHFEENPDEQCICIHDIGVHELDDTLAEIDKLKGRKNDF